jgi:prolyl-tRNA editing enzyme YbaK/EbsC (Cys-tRNA(Pro) deacylase)
VASDQASTSPAAPGKSGSLERVRRFLAARGLEGELVAFDDRSTKTCELAAEAVGCSLGQIAKCLVFVADGRPLIAIVAGDRKGDPPAIATAVSASTVRFADADAVRSATGYAIGGVSPYDLPPDLPVLVDDALLRFDTLYTAAGTPAALVRIDRTTLLDIVRGRVARISR